MKIRKILILGVTLLTLSCLGQKVLNDGVLKSLKIQKDGEIILDIQSTSDTSKNSNIRFDKIKWKDKKTSQVFMYDKGKKTKGFYYEVHYIGFFADGAQFDNSFSRGEPLKFNAQDNYLLASFAQAIQNFKKGGIGLIQLKPEHAYGNVQAGNIPANSTLYYLVQVINIY